MGVDKNTLALFGWRLDKEQTDKLSKVCDEHYERTDEDLYDKLMCNECSLNVYPDCYSGEFTYIGICLAYINEYDDDEELSIGYRDFIELPEQLNERLLNMPAPIIDLIGDMEPELHVTMYYT